MSRMKTDQIQTELVSSVFLRLIRSIRVLFFDLPHHHLDRPVRRERHPGAER